MTSHLHGLPLISRNALPLCSFTLLVLLFSLLRLAFPRDLCLFSAFYLLLILGLYLYPVLWRVILIPMSSKRTSTARHHKFTPQCQSFLVSRISLMHGCRLIACFLI